MKLFQIIYETALVLFVMCVIVKFGVVEKEIKRLGECIIKMQEEF